MADGKVVSFVGGPGVRFAGVRGEDGEHFDFSAGVKYDVDEVPKSVLKAVEDGVKGLEFEVGSERVVDNKLEKALAERAEGDQKAEED